MVRPRVAFAALLSCLLAAPSAHAGINFVGAELTSVPPQAEYMATGDINNDGRLDVVVVSPQSKNVSTYLAANTPSYFAPARTVRVGDTLRGLALGDLNRDGRLDIVVADQAADGVWILLGRGDGTYLDPYLILVPNSRTPYAVAINNWDDSGGPDLAVADRRQNKVFILLNDNGSPPRFRRGGDFVVGLGPEFIAPIDLNNDGKKDIVTLNLGGARVKDVSVALFKRVAGGFPEFDPPVQYIVGENPNPELIWGDWNNDGNDDLAMLNRPAGTGRISELDIIISNGNGTLNPPNGIPVPCPFFTNGQPCRGLTLTAGDFDTNGTMDIAVAITDPRSRGSNVNLVDAMQVFGGRGDGGFVAGPVFAIQKAPRSMAAGDITGSGKDDIAIAAQRSLSLQTFVNVSSPGTLPNGASCVVGDECLSARCTNGVCCASACEPNELCNIPGHEGTCYPQSNGSRPCEDASFCEDNEFCVDGECCDSPCIGGRCDVPGFEGICIPGLADGEPCFEDDECSSGFCSPNGRCCREACLDGYCDEFGVCSSLEDLGEPCDEDAQCISDVCDPFDLICCNRRCLPDTEYCNEDGFCTPFEEPITPLVTVTATTPTPTATIRLTPGPDGELCSIGSECQSGFCVNSVCCMVESCPDGQHCAEGSGMCVDGGTPTPTRTPTSVQADPCDPNPCPKGRSCVVNGDQAQCVFTSSSSGCNTGGNAEPPASNLLLAAMLPLALWGGRRWHLARARASRR